jgi:hypothetical protein
MMVKQILAFLLAGLVSTSVQAHTDEYFDTKKGPNGGQVRMAGIYHLELVLLADSTERKTQQLKLYVSDHGDQPKAAAGATANILLVSGKQKSSAQLTPAGNNLLTGTAEYAASPDLQAVVQLTMPGEGHGPIKVQAKFTPFKVIEPSAQSVDEKDGHGEGHHHHH